MCVCVSVCVHASSSSSQLATWFFTTFTASSIKEKVQNMDGVQYLYDVINPDQLQIPQFVLDYDIQVGLASLVLMLPLF